MDLVSLEFRIARNLKGSEVGNALRKDWDLKLEKWG